MTGIKKIYTGVFIVFGMLLCLFLFLRYSGNPRIQYIRTQLIATAMTTQSHQGIASIVAPAAEIAAVMANAITETDIQSEITDIVIYPENDKCTEGFDFLEEGLYIRDISTPRFDGKLMLVLDPSRISVATAKDLGSQGSMVSEMAAYHNAVAAINGGFFAGPAPTGFVIAGNVRKFPNYTHTYPTTIAGFTGCNVLVIGAYTEPEALAMGVRDSLSTYPVVIVDGEPQITEGDGGWGWAPRTAIAQRRDGAVLLLVIEGRRLPSLGATLRQAQDVLMEHKAHNAIFLDGGSSSVMYYRGNLLTTPSLGFERDMPTAFWVR